MYCDLFATALSIMLPDVVLFVSRSIKFSKKNLFMMAAFHLVVLVEISPRRHAQHLNPTSHF